jgi:hypothetical protein
MSQKNVRWLLGELPTLLENGVIDGAAAERLRRHYESAAGPSRNWALTIFGILGGTLVGLGIILLLAHNWADLSRAGRATALAFARWSPRSCWRCGFSAPARSPPPGAKASACSGRSPSGAAIALVAQTYHIPGDAGRRFAQTWMLLTLPIDYPAERHRPRAGLPGRHDVLGHRRPKQRRPGPAVLAAGRADPAPRRFFPRRARQIPTPPPPGAAVLGNRLRPVRRRRRHAGKNPAGALDHRLRRALRGPLPGRRVLVRRGAVGVAKPFQTFGEIGGVVLAFLLTYDWPWKRNRLALLAPRRGLPAASPPSLDYSLAALLPAAAMFCWSAACGAAKPTRCSSARWRSWRSSVSRCGADRRGAPPWRSSTSMSSPWASACWCRGSARGGPAPSTRACSSSFALILLRFFDEDLRFVFRGRGCSSCSASLSSRQSRPRPKKRAAQ